MEQPKLFECDFSELTRQCAAFYIRNRDCKDVMLTRAALAPHARAFHERGGTLTSSVQKRLKDLERGNCVVLMTGHQPNFFPYSGVLRKATLMFTMAQKLEADLGVPVVSFFGLADQDFTDDRWVQRCQLPSIARASGCLDIEAKLGERLRLNTIPKPSAEVVAEWRNGIAKWLEQTSDSVHRKYSSNYSCQLPPSLHSTLRNNFRSFWGLVDDAYGRAESFSDLSAFTISKIVNEAWGYDTVFARFSECQQILSNQFSYLLSKCEDYATALREVMKGTAGGDIHGGVSAMEPGLVPFWYHCDCGSKARLNLVRRNGDLTGVGNCILCKRQYLLEFGPKDRPALNGIAARISARSIAMNLVFFKGVMPSCYVGGVGGSGYLKEAQHVGRQLGIEFPPIAIWRPRDRYLGLGQAEALLLLKDICGSMGAPDQSSAKEATSRMISEAWRQLEELTSLREMVGQRLAENPDDEALKREKIRISMLCTNIKKTSRLSLMSRQLSLLECIETTVNLMPSIIDYAVNIGLKQTSDQWIRHLNENGDLSLDVHLESLLGADSTLCRNFTGDPLFSRSEETRAMIPNSACFASMGK
jgi:hypothetical protein